MRLNILNGMAWCNTSFSTDNWSYVRNVDDNVTGNFSICKVEIEVFTVNLCGSWWSLNYTWAACWSSRTSRLRVCLQIRLINTWTDWNLCHIVSTICWFRSDVFHGWIAWCDTGFSTEHFSYVRNRDVNITVDVSICEVEIEIVTANRCGPAGSFLNVDGAMFLLRLQIVLVIATYRWWYCDWDWLHGVFTTWCFKG